MAELYLPQQGTERHLVVARGVYAGGQVRSRRRQSKGNNGAVLLDFLHWTNVLPIGRGYENRTVDLNVQMTIARPLQALHF